MNANSTKSGADSSHLEECRGCGGLGGVIVDGDEEPTTCSECHGVGRATYESSSEGAA